MGHLYFETGVGTAAHLVKEEKVFEGVEAEEAEVRGCEDREGVREVHEEE